MSVVNMKISEILKIDRIIPEFEVQEKEEIINQLVNLFIDDPRVSDIEKVRQTVIERERIMSTGVGNGFAIPHGKTDSVTEIIAGFAKTNKPIDFEALDGEPVNLIFLLVGKENMVGPHIKLLSRISRMMNKEEFRASLAAAKSAQEIYDIFCDEENKYIEL